jgi:cellulose synthase A
MKGLDGIQGPMYVGTGCCFNRQALYGYDPVLTEADLEPNIIVKSLCGGRKKKNKSYMDNKNRMMKRTESSAPIFNMEDIEEGIEGMCFVQFYFQLWHLKACICVDCITKPLCFYLFFNS